MKSIEMGMTKSNGAKEKHGTQRKSERIHSSKSRRTWLNSSSKRILSPRLLGG